MKDCYIGLMVEDSSAILIGLLGIIKSGNCIVPINPAFPDDRIRFIVEDCQIETILTDKTNHPRVQQVARGNTCLEHVICIDDIDFEKKIGSPDTGNRSHSRISLVQPEQPCYVIFTSGSTGNPKGVPITHTNLVPLLSWFHDYFKLGDHIKILQNLSYTFDFGIFELVTTLLAGGVLYFFNRKELSDLNEYVDFIHRHQLNTIHTTPSFFTNVIDSGRSLASLKLLHFGGEKLTRKIVEDVSRQVGENCYIYNGYGPTETTINSSIFAMQVETDHGIEVPDSIPIGKPSANNIIYILDAYGNLQPVGVVGELYIGGSGVARGYLNRPELTAEKFVRTVISHSSLVISSSEKLSKPTNDQCPMTNDHSSSLSPNDQCPMTNDRLYRTGDLGRWLPDGNIEFLGRIDYQVKIRGLRIELGEIENRLLGHEAIKEAVVVDFETGEGYQYLCAYIVWATLRDRLEGEGIIPNIGEIREYLAQTLPDYMIPSYFVELDKLPLNPNGKVDMKALPEPKDFRPGREYAAPRNEIEKKLAGIWQQVLHVDRVGINENFFDIGGHSLKALSLVNAIKKEFNIQINFQDVFQYSTIAAIHDLIRKSEITSHWEIEKQPEKEYYELSYTQRRLWLLYQFEPDSPAFNLGGCLTLYEKVEKNIIEKVLERLVNRHESFRTCFRKIAGEPVQIIQPASRINLEVIDLSHLSGEELKEARQRLYIEEDSVPFNLEVAPLLRIKLIACKEKEFDLLFTMHHIISDGWSLEVLEQEFMQLYESYKKGIEYEPEPLRISYRDYAVWHNRLLADERQMKAGKDFWKSQLAGQISMLDLPYDHARPRQRSEKSAGYRIVIPGEITQNLRKLAIQRKASLFMVLLAGFNLLLSDISGQDDIVIGLAGAGRQNDDLKNLIGFFVNTLILRTRIKREESFTGLLARVQESMLQVLEHQSFPLELICGELKIKYPEISVFFNMITFGDMDRQSLENLESFHMGEVQDAKFDMVCYLREYKNCVAIDTHYYMELFKTITIEKIMQKYLRILEDISLETGDKELFPIDKQKKKTMIFRKKRRIL